MRLAKNEYNTGLMFEDDLLGYITYIDSKSYKTNFSEGFMRQLGIKNNKYFL